MKLWIKRFCWLMAFWLSAGAFAATVGEADVRLAAKGWRAQTDAFGADLGRGVASVAAHTTTNGATFYAVKLNSAGTVFMNSDDTLEPVIGFTSATNDFSTIDPKSPLWALLNRDVSGLKATLPAGTGLALQAVAAPGAATSEKAAKWARLIAAGQPSLAGTSLGTTTPSDLRVAALVQSKWSQGSVSGHECYNYYTPNHYVCGCVATAMAQVMRYHQYPTASMPTFTRTCSAGGTSADYTSKGGTYDWENMPLQPARTTYSDTQWEAIGKLCYDAGVAVNMGWASGGSGSLGYESGAAMKAHFGYANAMMVKPEGNVTQGGSTRATYLQKVFFSNFDAGFPLLVSVPGHEIVADGYGYVDTTDYVHFNMGWTGQDDYWYNIPDLTDADKDFTSLGNVCYNVFPTQMEGGAVLSGRVLDASGAACAGATVRIDTLDGTTVATLTTSAQGVWGTVLAAGTYTIRAANAAGTLKGVTKGVAVEAPTYTTTTVYSNSQREVDYVADRKFGNSWGNDVVVGTAVYARYADGAFTYYDADLVAAAAPSGGMNANVTILFSTDAEYQALALLAEAKKAKGLELEADVTFAAETDWRTLPVEFAGHTVTLDGATLKIANMPRTGTVTGSNSSVLNIEVADGETFDNTGLTLTGGSGLQVWKTGAGSLTMSKVNTGFGANGVTSVVVKAGYMSKSTNGATCGNQYSRIVVEDGGQFDIAGRSYHDYDYTLSGSGVNGAGAICNTVSDGKPWYTGGAAFMRHVTLVGDTTLGGTTAYSMAFWQSGQNWMYMNGHTLTITNTAVYTGGMTFTGAGKIVVGDNAQFAFCDFYNCTPTSPDVTLDVRGYLEQVGCMPTVLSNLVFSTAAARFCNSNDNHPSCTVRDTYAPNQTWLSNTQIHHPVVTLGAEGFLATTLDLSLFTDAFDSSTTTFYVGSTVTVNLGARSLANNEKIVSWSTAPTQVTFTPSGEAVTDDVRLLVKSDGLYFSNAPAYATWDVENKCWKYFRDSGAAYAGTWTAGVADIEARCSSIAEIEAIGALSEKPAKIVLTALALPAGSQTYDLSGYNFTVLKDTVIDVKGNKLKLPTSVLGGDAFTVTDSSYTSEATVPDVVSSSAIFWLDANDASTMTVDSDNKVQTWTSKDANHVMATATSAPTYGTTGNGLPTVDFGAAGSGLDMSYTRFSNIRTVFWVVKIAKTEAAFLLGDTDSYNFHRGSSGQYGCGNSKYSKVWNGTTQVNYSTDIIPDDEFQVITVLTSENANSNRLTTDRTCSGRHGGRQLSELICFSSELSDEDRTAVTEYLQKKWFTVAAPGELILDVPEGTSVENTNVRLLGHVKLVKAGTGTLTASKTNAFYFGGTEIAAGQLTVGNASSLGHTTGAVQVDATGTLEINGVEALIGYDFVLNGGTIQNTKSGLGAGNCQLAKVRLTADSTMKAVENMGLVGGGYAATSLDLAGHTLTVNVSDGKDFYFYNVDVTKGTLAINGDGLFKIEKTSVRAPETTFRVNCALDVWAPLTMGTYVPLYSGSEDSGSDTITVTERFKPNGNPYRAFTFGDGAILDLSEATAVVDGTNMNFTAGTTVNVTLGARVLSSGLQLTSWNTEPRDVDFVASGDNVGEMSLLGKADGLYLYVKPDYARYDATQKKWIFYASPTQVYSGDWLEGVVNTMTVLFSSDADYQALVTVASDALKARKIQLDTDLTLTTAVDWSALPVDLGGHTVTLTGGTLTVATPPTNGTIVGATGTLVFNVAEGESLTTSGLVLKGDAGLTIQKTGAGTLSLPTVPDATKVEVKGGAVNLAESSTATLVHRYSFDGDANDSVGTQNGTVSDASYTTDGKSLSMSTSSSVDFGSNLLPKSGPVTIEIWDTFRGTRQSWEKIFFFGKDGSNHISATLTTGSDTNTSVTVAQNGTDTGNVYLNQAGTAAGGQPENALCHLTVILNGKMIEAYLHNAETHELLGRWRGYNAQLDLATLDQTYCWLGKNCWNNATPNMDVTEMRIWNTALTETQITNSIALGPDTLPVDIGTRRTSAATAVTVASGATVTVADAETFGKVSITGAGSVKLGADMTLAADADWRGIALDLNGHTLSTKGYTLQLSSLPSSGTINGLGPNIALNGDFEADADRLPSTYNDSWTPTGWSSSRKWSNRNIALVRNDSSWLDDHQDNSVWCSVNAADNLWQDVVFPQTAYYQLKYKITNRHQNGWWSCTGHIYVNGQQIEAVCPGSGCYERTWVVKVEAGTRRLQFSTDDSDYGILLDNVSLNRAGTLVIEVPTGTTLTNPGVTLSNVSIQKTGAGELKIGDSDGNVGTCGFSMLDLTAGSITKATGNATVLPSEVTLAQDTTLSMPNSILLSNADIEKSTITVNKGATLAAKGVELRNTPNYGNGVWGGMRKFQLNGGTLEVGESGLRLDKNIPGSTAYDLKAGTVKSVGAWGGRYGQNIFFGETEPGSAVTFDLGENLVNWNAALMGWSDVTLKGSANFQYDKYLTDYVQGALYGKLTVENTGSNDLRGTSVFHGGLELAEGVTAQVASYGDEKYAYNVTTGYGSDGNRQYNALYDADAAPWSFSYTSANFFGFIHAFNSPNPYETYTGFAGRGKFYVPAAKAGTWTFAGKYDDFVDFWVDGTEVLRSASSCCQFASGKVTLAEGWHTFTLGVGDNSGGCGPTGTWQTQGYSLGFDVTGADATDDATKYTKFAPGASLGDDLTLEIKPAAKACVWSYQNGNGNWETTENWYHVKAIDSVAVMHWHSGLSDASTWSGYLSGKANRFAGWFKVAGDQKGTWTFHMGYDDNKLLNIDGERVVNTSSWNVTASGTKELNPGWHRWEVRVQDGSGGWGPSGANNGNTLSYIAPDSTEEKQWNEDNLTLAATLGDIAVLEPTGIYKDLVLGEGSTLTSVGTEAMGIYGMLKGNGTLTGKFVFKGTNNCWVVEGSGTAEELTSCVTFENAERTTFQHLAQVTAVFTSQPTLACYPLTTTAIDDLEASDVASVKVVVQDANGIAYPGTFRIEVNDGTLRLVNDAVVAREMELTYETPADKTYLTFTASFSGSYKPPEGTTYKLQRWEDGGTSWSDVEGIVGTLDNGKIVFMNVPMPTLGTGKTVCSVRYRVKMILP